MVIYLVLKGTSGVDIRVLCSWKIPSMLLGVQWKNQCSEKLLMKALIKRVNEKEYHSLYAIAEFRVNLKMSLSYPHMIHDFHLYQSQMDAER